MLVYSPLGLWSVVRRRPNLVAGYLNNVLGQLGQRVARANHHGASPPPEQLTIVVTDACNLRCKMCQYAYSDAPGYQLNQVGKMPLALHRKLLDEIPGHPIVSLTGGEPLLHPEIAEFVAYAKHRRCICTLTTNGWLLAKRSQSLCDAGLDVVIVSVDGLQEAHNRIRGKNSFERLSEGLAAILALPRRPVVFVSMAITDLNWSQVVPMYEWVRSLGVDAFSINHLWMQTHGMVESHNNRFSIFAADEVAWEVHPELVDPAGLADGLETVRRRNQGGRLLVTETPILTRRQIITWYHQPEEFVKFRSTRCAWIRMKVWPDGRVKPCREWSAGNVAEQHALEVWDSPEFRQFRLTLNQHGSLPICARCCYMQHR